MLPFPCQDGIGSGVQSCVLPQPKFPNQAEPRGSMVTPKPPPRTPPPIRGDRGVPFAAIGRLPIGLKYQVENTGAWCALDGVVRHPSVTSTVERQIPGATNQKVRFVATRIVNLDGHRPRIGHNNLAVAHTSYSARSSRRSH